MLNVSNVLSVTGFFNIHDSLHISIFDIFCFFCSRENGRFGNCAAVWNYPNEFLRSHFLLTGRLLQSSCTHKVFVFSAL